MDRPAGRDSRLSWVGSGLEIWTRVQLWSRTRSPLWSLKRHVRRQLHWLPIRQRVNFKPGTVQPIHTGTPTYLACELHRHQPPRAMHSGTTTTLHRPHASSDFHQHSFAVCTGYLEQYTCFHPRFWHLGHFQDCSEKTPLQLRLHVMPLTAIHWRLRIHSFVTYGTNHRNICD